MGSNRNKKGFTVVELLVVVFVIAVLMGILVPTLNKARRHGRRVICQSNLRQLMLGWSLYADYNDDRIVNGRAYEGENGTNGEMNDQLCWTGDDVDDEYGSTHLPEDVQLQAIQAGALFTYVNDSGLYRCPTGQEGHKRTYSIVDSMNGSPRSGTYIGNSGIREDNITLWIKKRYDITDAVNRIVFIDIGRATSSSYAVNYNEEIWLDPAHCRHDDGTTVAFADGHTDYWRWIGLKTISNAKLPPGEDQYRMQPESRDDYEDLYRVQRGVWGRLGYIPTYRPLY